MFRRTLILSLPILLAAACADPVDDSDAGPDAGSVDEGTPVDMGVPDRGPVSMDAEPADEGLIDSSLFDLGQADLGEPDAGEPDAQVPDTGPADLGVDAGPPPFPIQVAYRASATAPDTIDLFLTDTSTSRRMVTPVLVGGPTGMKKGPQTQGVRSFVWTPDATGLIYLAQQETFGRYDMYLAPLTGTFTGPTVRLSPPNTTSNPYLPRFTNDFSATNAYFFFTQSTMANGTRLHVGNTVQGTAGTQVLSGGLSLRSFVAPTGSRVIFSDILVSANDRDFWVADAAAAPPSFDRTRVNPGANIGAGQSADWSSNGNQVAYIADERGTRLFELFVADISGTTITNRRVAHPPLGANSDANPGSDKLAFSPDSANVAFIANPRVPAESDLFLVDLSASLPQPLLTLSGPVTTGASGVQRFVWSPNSSRVLYASEQDIDNTDELYIAERANPGVSYKVNIPLAAGQNAFRESWISDDAVMYLTGGVGVSTRLWLADVSNLSAIVVTEVQPNLTATESVSEFAFARIGSELLIRVDDQTNQSGAFYIAEIQNGAVTVPSRLITPTGPGAVFCGDSNGLWLLGAPLEQADRLDLFAYFPGAAEEFRKVNGPLAPEGRVLSCAFAP